MHSQRDVHEMGEGVGVEVERDRGRSAAENALSARILVCGQPIDLVAAIIVNVPCTVQAISSLKSEFYEHGKESCTDIG